jgi:hypothetical protein
MSAALIPSSIWLCSFIVWLWSIGAVFVKPSVTAVVRRNSFRAMVNAERSIPQCDVVFIDARPFEFSLVSEILFFLHL